MILRLQGWRLAAALLLGFLTAALTYAWLLGGFAQEYLSDGAIHYTTAALVADYLRHGLLQNPLNFLDDYYRHYPLAGFGLWPPAWYGLAGLWGALFGTGRTAMVLLSVAIAAACSATLAGALWRRAGWPCALFAGLVLLLMPAQSSALRTLLIDPLNGLEGFVAAWLFARYLTDRTLRSALLFAAVALLSVYTKGNGLMLALLPLFAIPFTGQWSVLRDWRLWLAGAIVGVVAFPWYILTAGFAAQGFRHQWGLAFFVEAVPANAVLIVENFGPLVLLLAAVGLWRMWRQAEDAIWWRTMAALVFACFLFQSLVPAFLNLRYLFAALFPIAAFAAAGLSDIARGGVRYAMIAGAVGAGALASLAVLGAGQPELDRLGAAPAAVAAMRAAPAGTPILVATSGLFEAGAIAELAAADPDRPSRFAVRGSRLLGGGGYYATDYKPLYTTPAQAGRAIDRLSPSVVLVEHSAAARRWGHVAQVEALAAAQPARWRRVADGAGVEGRRWSVYRLAPAPGAAPNTALARELNANRMLSAFAKR